MTRFKLLLLSLLVCPALLPAQETLTLKRCRELALMNNEALKQEEIKVQMSGYDKKTARANYFPSISVNGAYLHNGDNISLLNSDQSLLLTNAGTLVQAGLSGKLTDFMTLVESTPALKQEYESSRMWQAAIGALKQTDVSAKLNELGAGIDKALHFDIANVGVAAVSLQQPVFVGGKIVASNKIARMAEELAEVKYEGKKRETVVDVDKSYWQVVSISAKKDLAMNYSDLLSLMLNDAAAAVKSGVATEADLLSVKVKANEASLALSRATNGLKLAKMLLCKQLGLPLDSDIRLEHEGVANIDGPLLPAPKTIDEICNSRPEMKQLDLATRIFDKKISVVRADYLPKLAVTANYILSNPNVKSGFSKTWGGTWNAGVVLSIPVFHGTEGLQKTRKAQAEARLYAMKREEAKHMITLQVSQLRCQYEEAQNRYKMAMSSVDGAEENLRAAMAGFEAGVIPSNTAMAAQTAWLQAHSELIDAGINLQMTVTNINNAEGNTL